MFWCPAPGIDRAHFAISKCSLINWASDQLNSITKYHQQSPLWSMDHKSQINLSKLLNLGSHVKVTQILKAFVQHMRGKQLGLPSTRVRQERRHVFVDGKGVVSLVQIWMLSWNIYIIKMKLDSRDRQFSVTFRIQPKLSVSDQNAAASLVCPPFSLWLQHPKPPVSYASRAPPISFL